MKKITISVVTFTDARYPGYGVVEFLAGLAYIPIRLVGQRGYERIEDAFTTQESNLSTKNCLAAAWDVVAQDYQTFGAYYTSRA